MDATKIHRSRKGTQLNDAHYFRRPLPHTRKRMTMMKIFPTLSDNKKTVDCNLKKKKRFNNLDIEQPSTEITLVSYEEQSENNQSSVPVSPRKIIPAHEEPINCIEVDKNRDYPEILTEPPTLKIEILKDNISIETIRSEGSKEIITVLPEENSAVAVENENDSKFEINEVKDDEEEIEEKLEDLIEEKSSEEDLMSISNDEKLKDHNNNSNNKTWWKIIIDFFGSLVGKRDYGNVNDKGSKKTENLKEVSKTMTLVTAKPGNPNIYQTYVSSLESNKEKHRMKREARARKEKKNQHFNSDKDLKNRKISSPL